KMWENAAGWRGFPAVTLIYALTMFRPMLLKRQNYIFLILGTACWSGLVLSRGSLPTASRWRAMTTAQVLLQLCLEPRCRSLFWMWSRPWLSPHTAAKWTIFIAAREPASVE